MTLRSGRRTSGLAFIGLASVAAMLAAGAASAGTLDTVKTRGSVACGVNQGLLGFALADEAGKWAGFDVDFCKAVAAAVLGDAEKVTYVPVSATDRFEALKAGKIDVLARNSTWTLQREAELGISFVGVTYYDGQGFMVKRSSGKESALDLDGAAVCVQTGTTTEPNFIDFFTTNNMKYTVVAATTPDESVENYKAGRCDVLTSDVSQLYAERATLPDPGESLILPDVISKEPLAPAVRDDDAQWRKIVEWVNFALINAEEYGISSDRLDEAKASKKPEVMRIVGTDGSFGEKLGLSNDWVIKIVGSVGNYGEIYERNLGVNSKLGIPRGLNQLWSKGGIQYAPPLR
ncbi:amino acid ABC transporter substrate-binding protein [Kaistia dalseonensis]|uniref:General L-amino acid transport system substrate-binding protein n=1 Tax=Kaistia dalseonensis TaxID=410840 RepID=A0ABU0H4G4_9HYPH|nr:amino acid ABC transporter substrate-binding protein [Kaistia dalseonensis]MCX5493844.1 amino acid ABC transporter substrate-binding protein [Kaistia dalseonensis]MDQ0436409.1 general L-amino acid transport system substrate-binding protein [Kaistia dalseonensis]